MKESEAMSEDRIDKELTPVIKKTFAYHDKDGNGLLSYDESIILFSNYAERLGCATETTSRNPKPRPFMKVIAELTTSQMLKLAHSMDGGKAEVPLADLAQFQKELLKAFRKLFERFWLGKEFEQSFGTLKKAYDADMDSRHKALLGSFRHLACLVTGGF